MIDTTDGHLDLYTVREAAGHLKVSSKSIRRWIAAGDLSVVQLGRNLRISRTELERFIAERTAKRSSGADQ